MSQRQKKTRIEKSAPATQPRPAGIQSMDLKLYELVQQAIKEMAGSQVRAGAAG
ncbi:MAG TPA: hypothetical protein VGK67_00075 [Myxococcales bacterium]|jgi:hypothetical protein